jgi:peptide/nickel transport system substrate-binding protein
MKRTWMKGTRTALAAIAITAAAGDALAQGTLRVGMTASDIPLTTGQRDNGGDFSPIWMAK